MSILLGFFPFAVLALLIRKHSVSVGLAILLILTWSSVELGSLFDKLSVSFFQIFWSGVLVITAVYLYTGRMPRHSNQVHFFEFNSEEKLSFVGLFLIAVLALIAALLWPPNTWDSMTYHMTRVYQWLSRGSIEHFTAGTERQNELGPFAEMLILHLYAMTGKSDRLANLPQFFSGIVSVFYLCRISIQILAANRQTQKISSNRFMPAVLFVSAPMVLLQATSTQNDLTATALILLGVSGFIDLIQTAEIKISFIFISAVGFGFSFLTKPLALFFFIPVLIFFMIRFRIISIKKLALSGAIILLIFSFIQFPHAFRNYRSYGNPLGGSSLIDVKNQFTGPSVATANLVRNSALHLVVPNHFCRTKLTDFVRGVVKGVGVDPDDLTLSYAKTSYDFPVFEEDHAGNAILFLLFLIMTLKAVIDAVCLKNSASFFWSILTWISLFSFSWIFKWQPWQSRLMTPWFANIVLFLVFAASSIKFSSIVRKGFIVCVFLFSAVVLFKNQNRPLYTSFWAEPREKGYFVKRPELYIGFREMAELFSESKCKTVATCTSGDSWEYPLMQMIRLQSNENIIFSDVARSSVGANFRPCALLVFDGASCAFKEAFNYSDQPVIKGYGHELWM